MLDVKCVVLAANQLQGQMWPSVATAIQPCDSHVRLVTCWAPRSRRMLSSGAAFVESLPVVYLDELLSEEVVFHCSHLPQILLVQGQIFTRPQLLSDEHARLWPCWLPAESAQNTFESKSKSQGSRQGVGQIATQKLSQKPCQRQVIYVACQRCCKE